MDQRICCHDRHLSSATSSNLPHPLYLQRSAPVPRLATNRPCGLLQTCLRSNSARRIVLSISLAAIPSRLLTRQPKNGMTHRRSVDQLSTASSRSNLKTHSHQFPDSRNPGSRNQDLWSFPRLIEPTQPGWSVVAAKQHACGKIGSQSPRHLGQALHLAAQALTVAQVQPETVHTPRATGLQGKLATLQETTFSEHDRKRL